MTETQIYKVRDPSGTIREIRGPMGASDSVVLAKAKELFGANPAKDLASQIPTELGANLTPSAPPEVSMRDRISGIIETPMALGATLAGGLISPIAGGISLAASGKGINTPEGRRAMEAGMKAVQYQPRTQTAQQALGAFGEFLQPLTAALPPTLGSVGTTVNALAVPTMQQAGAATRQMAGQVMPPVQNALARVLPTPQQPQMQGMGAATTADQLMREERFQRQNIRTTAGQREKNLQKQQFESDVERGSLPGISPEAKEELSQQYRSFTEGQKQDILNRFELMTEEVGGTVDRSSPRSVGNVIDKTLVKQYENKLKKVDDAYQKARDAGETKQIVDTSRLDQWLIDNAPESISVPQIQTIGAKLKQLKEATGNQVSIDDLENIYKVAGNLAEGNPSAAGFMGKVKSVINEMTEGTGGDLYRAARSERKQLAKQFEDVKRVDDLLSTKAGKTDRKVALDDVYKHVVLDGSLEEMRTVTQLLKKGGPEGQQAYKELQGYTLQRMKDLLLKKGDETDRIVFNNFNNFVTQLDREDKLAYMFGKTGRNELLDLQKSIQDVMVKQPGAVNYSGTGSVFMRGLDKILEYSSKVPLAKNVAEFARERQYKKQLEKALQQPNQLAPKTTKQNALVP
jgi:hypothetical protein